MNPELQLKISPTPHTAAAVGALRAAREMFPLAGSVCAALDAADPQGVLDPGAYREAVTALDVAARVFGHEWAADVGGHQPDAALLVDIAVFHLTGAPSDQGAAIAAFRRAAGPLLETTLR